MIFRDLDLLECSYEFGIDKFVLHEFYITWLAATERVKILLPIQDLGLSIYAIGTGQIVMGTLVFMG
ncbi:MAG: hypothetical protein ABR515_07225 [Nitrososphaeraceae archaeon]